MVLINISRASVNSGETARAVHMVGILRREVLKPACPVSDYENLNWITSNHVLAITPDADSFRKSDLELEWISAPELLCEAQAFASFNHGV
jgi:hypothetical protein